MRILHLASSHRWTGAAEPAAALARAQIDLGHQVEFACIKGHSFWRRLGKREVPRVDDFDFQTGIHLAGMRRDIHRLRRLIAENPYNVIHCHLAHDHWIAAIALRGLGAGASPNGRRPALVRTLHRDAPPRRDHLHRWLYASATDALIVVSESALDTARRRLGLPEGKAFRIGGAVDLDRFHPGLDRAAQRQVFGVSPDAAVAGIVARMQPHRRHVDFIKTISEVAVAVPSAEFIIAGRGELKKSVRARVRSHRLRERLFNVGYRKNDLPETYAAMDVSLLLAQGSDGACRAMLEAMACGRPVIGLRAGAIADTIEPGKTGWLVDLDRDPASLSRAIIEALSDPKRTAEMGRAARRAMEERFTQECRARAVLEVYESATTNREARR